jgi:hypothetical protein
MYLLIDTRFEDPVIGHNAQYNQYDTYHFIDWAAGFVLYVNNIQAKALKYGGFYFIM